MDLRLATLYSLHALNESSDQSSFAAHGANRDRISALARSPPCECGCRVPLKILQKTCESFWGLPKASQDSLLWSLQSEEGSSRRSWSIEGLSDDIPFMFSFLFWPNLKKCFLHVNHPAFVPEDTQYVVWHGFDILGLGSNGLGDASEFSME